MLGAPAHGDFAWFFESIFRDSHLADPSPHTLLINYLLPDKHPLSFSTSNTHGLYYHSLLARKAIPEHPNVSSQKVRNTSFRDARFVCSQTPVVSH